MYIFLAEASKIAYLYEDVIFLYVNLIIFDTRNSFIVTPREGVNGQQYEKNRNQPIDRKKYEQKIWLKKKTTKRGKIYNII